MPAARVRPGWTGKTKDQVVAKPDFIPEEVRLTPRPYLDIPQKFKTESIAERRAKRARRVTDYAPAPAISKSQLQRSSPPIVLSPPVMPESFGRPTFIAIDLINGSVEFKYENGGLIRESLPQRSNASSSAVAATRSTAATSKKRTAPVDDTESGPSAAGTDATMPPPLKRQMQARPVYEQATHNGNLENQAGVQDDVAVERREVWDSVDNDGSHGGVKVVMR